MAYTYTAIGTPIPLRAPGVDQALIYVRLIPKHERDISQDELGLTLRKELAQVGGASVSVFTSGFGGAMKQIQIEMRGEDPAVLTKLADLRRGRGAAGPGRGGRWALHPRANDRSWSSSSTAGWRARWV